MSDLSDVKTVRGINRHKVYHCPRCKRDWTPLHQTYWRFADTIASELIGQALDGVLLCNPCEFGQDRGNVRSVYIGG